MSLPFRLSRGVLNTISPPIPEAYAWAEKYDFSHGPLLDMAQGVPDRPPQQILREGLAIASASPDSFGYCPPRGELSLREAMVQEMRKVYGENIDVTSDDMALTSGCNLAFVATIMALADAGDEVILPVPWYFNLQMTLSMLNITTIPLQTRPEDGFVPSPSECKALITSKTKAIALVTPNNPTGATYPPEIIASFSHLAQSHNIALILDETYRDFIITTSLPPHFLFSTSNSTSNSTPPWRTHLIHLFSFSKSYAVPGHRLGLVAASPLFLDSALLTVLDSLQICAPRPIQLALAPLLPALRLGIIDTAADLAKRRELFERHLPRGWKVGSIGGYFAFVRHPFRRGRGKGKGAKEVCRRLAEEMGVVLLPADFFTPVKDRDFFTPVKDRDFFTPVKDGEGENENEERWIRFSVANCDERRILEVCQRLEKCAALFGWESDA